MSDIVERLRVWADYPSVKAVGDDKLLLEAADEIKQLRTEIERLRAELAAERERCAKLAETFVPSKVRGHWVIVAALGELAAAIRKGEP